MPYQVWLYLLGCLCLAVGIACYNRRKRPELTSFDVVTLMVMSERKSSGMWRKNVEPYL